MTTETQAPDPAREPVTLDQVAEAIESLDDCARMTIGVDASGPRELLYRFLEQCKRAAIPAPEGAPLPEGVPTLAELRERFAGIPDYSGKGAAVPAPAEGDAQRIRFDNIDDSLLDLLARQHVEALNAVRNGGGEGERKALAVTARALVEHAAANVQPKGTPVAWSRQQLIHDDAGYSIGTDEPELHWGKEPPDDEAGWHPLYAAAGVTTRDAALEEAAQLCELWNTTPGKKLAKEIRALATQAPAPAQFDPALTVRPIHAVKHIGA